MGSATKKKHEAYVVETSDESVTTGVLDTSQAVLVLPDTSLGHPESDSLVFEGDLPVLEGDLPSGDLDTGSFQPLILSHSHNWKATIGLAQENIVEGILLPVGEVPAAGLSATEKAQIALLKFGALSYDPSAEGYAKFVAGFEEAKQLLIAPQEAGGPAQVLQLSWDELKAFSKGFMSTLPVSVLEELAIEKGFPHPGLIGLHTPEGKLHPLAYWLDPYYGPDSSNKQEFVDKANSRWETLQSGHTLNGMNLAAYLALHPAEAVKGLQVPSTIPPKILTPEELKALQEEVLAKAQIM